MGERRDWSCNPDLPDVTNLLDELSKAEEAMVFEELMRPRVIKCENLTLTPVTKPPEPEQIIVSGPCTIVIWKDKTKTIVRCSDSEVFDVYAAFCAALAKKLYGTNSEVKRKIRKAVREEKRCKKT